GIPERRGYFFSASPRVAARGRLRWIRPLAEGDVSCPAPSARLEERPSRISRAIRGFHRSNRRRNPSRAAASRSARKVEERHGCRARGGGEVFTANASNSDLGTSFARQKFGISPTTGPFRSRSSRVIGEGAL